MAHLLRNKFIMSIGAILSMPFFLFGVFGAYHLFTYGFHHGIAEQASFFGARALFLSEDARQAIEPFAAVVGQRVSIRQTNRAISITLSHPRNVPFHALIPNAPKAVGSTPLLTGTNP